MERATHFSGRDIWSDFAKHKTFELRMEVLVDFWQVRRMSEHFNRVRTAGKIPESGESMVMVRMTIRKVVQGGPGKWEETRLRK